MQKAKLSSRERVRLALSHQEADRIPIAMVCSGINEPARSEFEAHLQMVGHTSLESYLVPLLDVVGVGPQYSGPSLTDGSDIWGVRYKTMSYGVAAYEEIDHSPLADAKGMDAVVQHPWPSPDGFDYTVLPERIAAVQADGERGIMVANGNIFETAWAMRGFEQIFMDLVTDDPAGLLIMKRRTEINLEITRRTIEAAKGGFDFMWIGEDLGTQNAPMMDPDTYRRNVRPIW